MARIRTIKPEYFHSETIASCSMAARLLGIAVLQLADVEGRFKWIGIQVHAHAFPHDEDVCVESLAQELERCGYLVRYVIDGKKYCQINNFTQHQRITGKEAQTESKIPAVPENYSSEDQGINGETSGCVPEKHLGAQEREREREREQGRNTDASASPGEPSGPPPCPHQQVIDLYHETLPELRAVKVWNGDRAAALKARWREDPKRQTLEYWRRYFAYVRQSDFLMGRKQSNNGRPPFQADLEWLVRPSNFAKVIEGKYHGEQDG